MPLFAGFARYPAVWCICIGNHEIVHKCLYRYCLRPWFFRLKSFLQGVGKSPTLGPVVQGCETENSENQDETTNTHNW